VSSLSVVARDWVLGAWFLKRGRRLEPLKNEEWMTLDGDGMFFRPRLCPSAGISLSSVVTKVLGFGVGRD
jgi:hypothetical protein